MPRSARRFQISGKPTKATFDPSVFRDVGKPREAFEFSTALNQPGHYLPSRVNLNGEHLLGGGIAVSVAERIETLKLCVAGGF